MMFDTIEKKFSGLTLFIFVAFFTTSIKIWLASLGHNFDIESWEIAADLVREGKSVYANTWRYPYGPVWFYFLGALGYLAEKIPFTTGRENFHIWVAIFLSIVDLGLALLVRRMKYHFVALLFLLNPVTWLITGFHSQFDQMPVLIGLVALLLLPGDDSESAPWLSAILLGISLATKHCLLFFTLWLGIRYVFEKRDYKSAAIITILPPALFLLSFLPWAHDPVVRTQIINNVFRYNSDYLFSFVPKLFSFVYVTQFIEAHLSWIPLFSGYKFVWLVGMIAFGWHFRKTTVLELFLLNLLALMALSPSMGDQYLVIPAIACAFYWRSPLMHAFVLASLAFLLFYSPANVGILPEMKPAVEALSFIPLRRYLALAFFLLFLFLYKTEADRVYHRL